MLEFMKSHEYLALPEKAKLYVAITRATHIVGILVPDKFEAQFFNMPFWTKDNSSISL